MLHLTKLGTPQLSPGAKGTKTPQHSPGANLENSPSSKMQELPGTLQTPQAGSYETSTNSPNSPPDEWTTVVKNNKKTHCLVSPKRPNLANQTAFEDPIKETAQPKNKINIEWVFVTISTVARAAFPGGKLEATVKRFTNNMGAQL